MRLEVLLFGPLSTTAGGSRLEVEVEAGNATCGAVREAIALEHPDLAPLLPSHRFARNQELVDDETPVTSEDELALIGMVSGG